VKFIDEAIITVQSGDGGRGCVSFRREKFIPRGGPNGGDGGRGGDVILKASSGRRTLYQFRFNKLFKAKNGAPGLGNNKAGKYGQDLTIEIPSGTIISNSETGEILKDFTSSADTYVIATGGRGGQGNARFKSSTNRTPRFAQPGEPGEALSLNLELKLIADVGIIGLPNAGKSTLVGAITSANPKVGNYPFTTLTPSLGVVLTDWRDPFVVADIPGLIQGAHKGTGLGIRFLRHIERTRALVHLIDADAVDPDDPLASYHIINNELLQYSDALLEKPQIVVLNKLDLPGAEEKARVFVDALDTVEPVLVSASDSMGLDALKSQIVRLLDRLDQEEG
jgi:GTPase